LEKRNAEIREIWLDLFCFLKLGPVQTPRGPLDAGPAGSLRLIVASMGPGFQEWDPQIGNWDPQLITAIYWA